MRLTSPSVSAHTLVGLMWSGQVVGVDVPERDQLGRGTDAGWDRRVVAVVEGEVPGVDPQPLDGETDQVVAVEAAPPEGDQVLDAGPHSIKLDGRGIHSASASTSAAGTSSVITFTHASTTLAASVA